eukprot:6862665-Pyramimonas_sp.AAC.1
MATVMVMVMVVVMVVTRMPMICMVIVVRMLQISMVIAVIIISEGSLPRPTNSFKTSPPWVLFQFLAGARTHVDPTRVKMVPRGPHDGPRGGGGRRRGGGGGGGRS